LWGILLPIFWQNEPKLSLSTLVISGATPWWRDERKAFQIASALGGGSRLSLEILRELRLILRVLRFKRMAAEYFETIAALRNPPTAIAAE
jgi:hypothetical protein